MLTIHYTKSALESEKALNTHYLNLESSRSDFDYETCSLYQDEINALEETLRSGEGWNQSKNITYILDNSNFWIYEKNEKVAIRDCDIGLNTLKA